MKHVIPHSSPFRNLVVGAAGSQTMFVVQVSGTEKRLPVFRTALLICPCPGQGPGRASDTPGNGAKKRSAHQTRTEHPRQRAHQGAGGAAMTRHELTSPFVSIGGIWAVDAMLARHWRSSRQAGILRICKETDSLHRRAASAWNRPPPFLVRVFTFSATQIAKQGSLRRFVMPGLRRWLGAFP